MANKISEASGGKGGGNTLTPETQTSDTRLIEKAVRQGWDIPETVFQELPLRMLKIVRDGESERNKIAAARVLATLHSQNQDNDPAPQRVNVVNLTMQQVMDELDNRDDEHLANE